ncbi:MAG: sigma-70 family RNA polymerase sigma factor [Archangium sp.]|nr:sigma-70 family RNA polymerase sigma factor [Archangium sp.]
MVPDEALYERARGGDLAAFDVLYARYERRVFGFVQRLVQDRAEAEELFHDTFLNILEAPRASFDTATFAAWLFRIARNLALNRLRSKSRGAHAATRVAAIEDSPPTPEQRLVEEERAFALSHAVQRLPEGLADVFHLRSSGLSYLEIADVLSVPVGTVKSRMNSLVQHLKGAMP